MPADSQLVTRIRRPGPKKILALDGGGIRGTATVEVLARIEAGMRALRGGDSNLVLADEFDLIAGTSTGAIIASCLALGMTVAKIREFYAESGREMFDKNSLLARWRAKYDDDKLTAKLREVIGEDTLLGSDRLKTLLLMVMRNVTTDSPWPVTNNPFAKYNDRSRADCNLDLPLWQLVRASTAAPVYFPPEVVQIGPRRFVFEDGGVTTYNNPAFLAFLTATLEPYAINWPSGEDRMLVVSVGTGNTAKVSEWLNPAGRGLLTNAEAIPTALIYAALNEQDMLCRVFGRCRVGHALDREIGTLIGAKGPVEPRLFTYVRYDFDTSAAGLARLGITDVDPESVQKLDATDQIPALQRIGRRVGETLVDMEHYRAFV